MNNLGRSPILIYRHRSKAMFVFESDYVFNTARAFFYKSMKGAFDNWSKIDNNTIAHNYKEIYGYVKKSAKGETFIFKINELEPRFCRIRKLLYDIV